MSVVKTQFTLDNRFAISYPQIHTCIKRRSLEFGELRDHFEKISQPTLEHIPKQKELLCKKEREKSRCEQNVTASMEHHFQTWKHPQLSELVFRSA